MHTSIIISKPQQQAIFNEIRKGHKDPYSIFGIKG